MSITEHLWRGQLLDPNPANASAVINLALQRPGLYTLPPQPAGGWICKDPIVYGSNFAHLSGPGEGACTLVADDTGTVGGQDFIQWNDRMGCGLHNISLSATAPRTAGAALAITGADPASVGIDVLKVARHVIEDVDMDSQFIGLHVKDSVAAPSWLLYVNRGYWRNFSNGGYGIWQDTGNINPAGPGASQFYENLFIAGQNALAAASLANAGMRISGGGDCTFLNCETWAWKHGFHCDAPAGRLVQACHVQECLFDTCGLETFLVAPNATAIVTRWKVGGLWIGNGQDHGIKIVGPGAFDLQFDNVGVYSHRTVGKWGAIMDGCEKVTFTNLHVTDGTDQGFLMTGNAQSCGVIGSTTEVPGIRWQTDAGVNRYRIIGNDGLLSLAAVDNGGPIKSVIGNI